MAIIFLQGARSGRKASNSRGLQMSIEKFTICRNDEVYECFPHLCRTRSGRILLTYRESNGHVASEYCRLIVRRSDDTRSVWALIVCALTK